MSATRSAQMLLVGVIATASLALVGTAAAPADPVPATTPAMLVAAAKTADDAATAVHVKGMIGSGKSLEKLDLFLVKGKGATGSITVDGYRLQLVNIGRTLYIKGSQRFYTHVGGVAAGRLLRGSWIKGRLTNADFKSFSGLLNMRQFIAQTLDLDPTKVLAQGPTATVAGQTVVQITVGTTGDLLSLAATGTPYLVQISRTGAHLGSLTFTRWNVPAPLTPPARSITVH